MRERSCEQGRMDNRLDPSYSRRKDYKKAVDLDESRRKREDQLLSLRKSKREDSLQKKRRDIRQNYGVNDTGESLVGFGETSEGSLGTVNSISGQ